MPLSDADSRPVIAYIRVHLLRCDDELLGLKSRLAEFATGEGFVLWDPFVEESATDLTAFAAFVEAACRPEIRAVLLPSLVHLAAIASVPNPRQVFEKATDARVLLLDSPTSGLGHLAEAMTH